MLQSHKRKIWYRGEAKEDGPVPPPIPIPNCECGIPAEVKQSRHPKTAARAFYMCSKNLSFKWITPHIYESSSPCFFFQWIDGPDKFDPRIRLFAYEDETMLYHKFKRWVPRPPNPPLMTAEEKAEATSIRVTSRPLCHCGVPCKLQRPNLELPVKFTPFFRCKLTTHVRLVHLPCHYHVVLLVHPFTSLLILLYRMDGSACSSIGTPTLSFLLTWKTKNIINRDIL